MRFNLSLLIATCCCLLVTLLPLTLTHGAPRHASTSPVYRPVYPPYHTYFSYKSRLLEMMSAQSESTAHILQMEVSKEKTRDGERLYVMQLGAWHKMQRNGAEQQRQHKLKQQTTNDRSSKFAFGFIPPSTPKTPSHRPSLLLTFGEHAREFITVESFFYLLEYILAGVEDARKDCGVMENREDEWGDKIEGATSAAGTTSLDSIRLTSSPGYRARWSSFILDHIDLHLIGVTNPDGKMYIERSKGEAQDYCWRNTAEGIDLNRNSAWQFDGPGSSSQPGHEEYHGPSAFSEAETRFVRDLHHKHKYDAYVSVHSGEQQLFIPFVDTQSKASKRRRKSTALELEICQKVVNHPHMNSWLHHSGIGYEMNDYSADGTLMDYMAGVEEIPLVFCVELWGGPTHDDCFVQFNPSTEIVETTFTNGRIVKETQLKKDLRQMHIFYIRMINEIIEEYYGVKYVDPIEMTFTTATNSNSAVNKDAIESLRAEKLSQYELVCRVERALYETDNAAKRRTDQERVILQA